MITLFSGTPGSGKSYHAAVLIEGMMRHGGSIVSNFPIRVLPSVHPRRPFKHLYLDNSEITPDRLVSFAREHHIPGKEGQTLLIIDEAQVIWNCRDFTARDRRGWITFFAQHRKLGFDLLLISQNDRMLDRQIRVLIEYDVRHRKVDNFGTGGKLLSFFTGRSTWFIALRYWYGGNKLLLDREMIRYRPKIGSIYDSFAMFADDGKLTSALTDDAEPMSALRPAPSPALKSASRSPMADLMLAFRAFLALIYPPSPKRSHEVAQPPPEGGSADHQASAGLGGPVVNCRPVDLDTV